jgi:hypothetical protein
MQRFGFDFCPIHRATGLPCPGCGMTRAMAMVSHGKFAQAFSLHPFVVLVWPLMALVAITALLPQEAITRLERGLTRCEPWLSRASGVTLIAFGTFGVARFLALLWRGEVFP